MTAPPMTRSPLGTPAVRTNRRPLPEGAAKWATHYADRDGVPTSSPFPVPVDENERQTEHIRVVCSESVIVDGEKLECSRDEWIMPGDAAKFCPDHGSLLAAVQVGKPSLLPWGAMWKAVEKPARPGWVLAAAAAAGIGFDAGHVSPVIAFAGGSVLAYGAFLRTRSFYRSRALERGHIHAGQATGRRIDTINRRGRAVAYAGMLATGWLTIAASVDPMSLAGHAVWASLPLAWAVASASWWRYCAAGRNRPVPVAEVPEADAPEMPTDDALAAADAAQTWIGDIGFANTIMDAGTWQRTVAGWQAVIAATKKGALVGLTDQERMRTTTAKIAAGYGVKRAAITWIAEHDDDPNLALLLVQPNNPLSDGQIWEGPASVDMETGRAIVGRLINGQPLYEVLYKPGWGAPNRVTLGTTGGGKSERIRLRLVVERWAHYIDPQTGQPYGAFMSFLHDPKDMDSYGEFINAVHGYGTTRDDAHIMVDAFTREMSRRFEFKRSITWKDKRYGRERSGSMPWDPRVHGPILSAIWDEFHEMAGDKEFVTKIERLARKQRACGFTQEVASHGGTIGDMGSQVLRDLGGGITTLLRTKNALNAALTAGGAIVGDPRTLPGEPGMCFVVDGQTQSSMMARGAWIPYDEDEHEVTLYDYLFDANNNPIGYPAEIPPETQNAFGTEFMEWAAAGRKPGGRDAKASPSAAFTLVRDDLDATTAMRRILFEAGEPLSRSQITEHPLWRFGVTMQSNVLRKGQDAVPPWIERLPIGKGVFRLADGTREQMQGAVDEEHEGLAA